MLRVSNSHILKRSFSHARPIKQLNLNPPPPPSASQVFVKPPPPIRIGYAGPILFGVTATTSIFFAAGFIHEREKENFWQRLKKRTDGPRWSTIRDIIIDDKLILADLWEEKKKMWLEKKQAIMEDMKKKLDQYNSIPVEIKRVFLAGAQTYLSMTEAEKTTAGLIGINLLVFGAWRVPVLQPIMARYFTHNPGSGRSITLLTSCFSHRHFLPLTINMVALWAIGPLLHDVLGREQFVAMYLSLGINANVISHILSVALRNARPILPTSGASGSVYGLLAGAAYLYPNSSIFLPFVPTIPIQTSYAVPAFMSLDVAGIVMRWRVFDHFAHLSGAGLGLTYLKFGPTYIWPNVLKTVRSIKKKGNSGGGGDDHSGVLMEMPKKIKLRLFGKKAAVPEEQ